MEANELEKQIILLYNRGFQIKEIAKKVGKPRGTISGICARLTKSRKILGRGYGFLAEKKIIFKEPEWNYEPAVGISIFGINHKTCNFPCSKGVYCGGGVFRKGLCEEHYKLCWKIPEKKIRW